MKGEPGDIHVLDSVRSVKSGKLHPEPLGMIRLNAGGAARLKESS